MSFQLISRFAEKKKKSLCNLEKFLKLPSTVVEKRYFSYSQCYWSLSKCTFCVLYYVFFIIYSPQWKKWPFTPPVWNHKGSEEIHHTRGWRSNGRTAITRAGCLYWRASVRKELTTELLWGRKVRYLWLLFGLVVCFLSKTITGVNLEPEHKGTFYIGIYFQTERKFYSLFWCF